MNNKMNILWAVSSVGKGHIMRDLAIVNQLKILADVDIDWLAPDPAGKFLRNRGENVLECSSRLAGSGKTYEQIFSGCTEKNRRQVLKQENYSGKGGTCQGH